MAGRLKTSILLGVAVLVLVVSGCGGGGGAKKASPEKWISTFCGSVVTWEQTVKGSAGKLEGLLGQLGTSGKLDLKSLRGQMVGFLGGIVSATDALRSSIKAAGAPDVKDGTKIEEVVDSAFAKLSAEFEAAKKRAESLPTKDALAFASQAKALGSAIESSSNSIGSAFALGKYETPELDKAAKNNPTCQKLG